MLLGEDDMGKIRTTRVACTMDPLGVVGHVVFQRLLAPGVRLRCICVFEKGGGWVNFCGGAARRRSDHPLRSCEEER